MKGEARSFASPSLLLLQIRRNASCSLFSRPLRCDNQNMPADRALELPKLAEGLSELEVVIGAKARPVVAELRTRLTEAAGQQARGDLPGALNTIRAAMVRLSALLAELDPEDGAMMRAIAQRFTDALTSGDKGTARQAVDIMRKRAGDSKDEDDRDW